jgi:acetylornithine deacetylase
MDSLKPTISTFLDRPIASLSVSELLQQLVAFPTLSTLEKPLVDWLELRLSDIPQLKTTRIQDNLIVTLGSGHPFLLLNSHSDVVPLSESPDAVTFTPEIRDGDLYGRGSTDAKGCVSAMLKALIDLAVSGWTPKQGSVALALTVCEETSGEHNGMAHIRSLIDSGDFLTPDAAIVGEPTHLAPCIAQKGLLVLKIRTQGASGHAARVSGPNSIYGMADVLKSVQEIQFPIENLFLGHTRITPTQLHAGVANNVMPESAELTLDIRTIPDVSNAEIIERFQQIPGAEVRVHSDRFISVATDPDAKIVQIAQNVTQKEPFGSPTASDWVFLYDIPTIKLGPGHSELSHTAQEHIELSELEAGVETYSKIIRSYFYV